MSVGPLVKKITGNVILLSINMNTMYKSTHQLTILHALLANPGISIPSY